MPHRIQTDNGSVFISEYLEQWAHENNVSMDCSRPYTQIVNALVELFNGGLRDDCLCTFSCHWKMLGKRSSAGSQNITSKRCIRLQITRHRRILSEVSKKTEVCDLTWHRYWEESYTFCHTSFKHMDSIKLP